MSQPVRIAIGLLTIAPVILMILAFVAFFGSIEAGASYTQQEFYDRVAVPVRLGIAAAATVLAAMAVCVWHLMVRRAGGDGQVLLWIVLFVVGGVLALPAYWGLRIWPDDGRREEARVSSRSDRRPRPT